ncbi:MAG TPA: uL22 family ribosomal protein [archaeon]|nr:uL22 family ribosomal protein [archaeon]
MPNENYTFPTTKEDVSARTTMRASTKAAEKICRALNRKDFSKAKKFCAGLIEQTVSLDGKFHTKAAEMILELLESAEKNAVHRNLATEGRTLFISAHQGPKYLRARRKRMFGSRMKVTHVQAVLRIAKSVEKKTEKKVGVKEEKK